MSFQLRAQQSPLWKDDAAPANIELQRVYFGPDPDGNGGFQVAVAQSAVAPTREVLNGLFARRKGKKQIQLVVAVIHGETVHLFGPDPLATTLVLPASKAQRYLQAVLDEPDDQKAFERFASHRKSLETTSIPGFTNSGLFASYHIRTNVPKRPDWVSLNSEATPLLTMRGKNLIERLGFRIRTGVGGVLMLLADTEAPRAVAVLLDESEGFDVTSARYQFTPVAFGLKIAERQEVPWLLVLRKDQIRLYPGKDGVGVGQKGQTETYFEVDLSVIDDEFSALLPLVFSARALAKDGTAQGLLDESAKYATELGTRLRERIYEEVVPPLAAHVASQLPALGIDTDAEGLTTAYRLTLRIMFRLLFQAYAEDRQLLPSGRNERYDANSLKTIAQRDLQTETSEFSTTANSIWLDLVQVWDAIDQGNKQWDVPAYNGGLFSTNPAKSLEGARIAQISVPDSVLGPALKSLLTDINDDDVLGPVDFRSLSVREFGTIYEGLLESSLSVADADLTLDKNQAWVPATPGDEIVAPAGSVYFHSASGERKATGSYFTPKVIVDHLIERSVVPSLQKHLEKISGYLAAGKEAQAAQEFFDFRVADLAMGSGHFLVAAVDKIEAMMRGFLTENHIPGVRAELVRLADVAKQSLGNDLAAIAEVDEVSLLRRQVARRCIYGLDINQMAVELARLAIWIHTFVPGLPMSNLDHGLVCANSLTGIGTVEEALDALQPDRAPGAGTFFDDVIIESLATAKTLLADVANASEADKSEVEEAARLATAAKQAAEPSRKVFDLAVAARIGKVDARVVLDEESLAKLVDDPEVTKTAAQLRPAHMPYLFPEVFIRDNPGFDVLVGNPPWEVIKVEEQKWWGLRIPKLRSLPKKEMNQTIERLKGERPDLNAQFLDEIETTAVYRQNILRGPFPGLGGGGDPDLYQVFAWRNWQMVRTGGRVALVLPRMALSASGLEEWRKDVLRHGSFSDVCFLTNTGNWIFEGVDGRYSIGLTVVHRGGSNTVRFCGPFSNESAFRVHSHELAEVPANEFLDWSSTAAFPRIPDPKSVEIFRLMKQQPQFGEVRQGWEFRPFRELDATNDKHLYRFSPDEVDRLTPVLKGKSFNLWQPDAGEPYAYADTLALRAHLETKFARARNNARSAYLGASLPEGKLPMDFPRIAYRLVARSDDSRTTICALLPPGVSAQHSSQFLVRRQGTAASEALLLATLSSIPFDWIARRWVELNFTFEILNGLPIPRFASGDSKVVRLTEIAGRLAAIDGRYSEWAAEVGVPVGSVKTQTEKDDLIAELDALVSLLYGLSEDQVEHVFATFHRGWDYQSRLAAVLSHYRTWEGRK